MPIHRGEIYFVNLNPVQGREQAGDRPVLVLSVDAINRLPLVVAVVVGTKGENVTRDYPTNVRVTTAESGLPTETVFLCFQIRSLDPRRVFRQHLRAQSARRYSSESKTRFDTVSVYRRRRSRASILAPVSRLAKVRFVRFYGRATRPLHGPPSSASGPPHSHHSASL